MQIFCVIIHLCSRPFCRRFSLFLFRRLQSLHRRLTWGVSWKSYCTLGKYYFSIQTVKRIGVETYKSTTKKTDFQDRICTVADDDAFKEFCLHLKSIDFVV